MNAKFRDLLGSLLMLAFVASLWVQRDYITPFGGIFPDIVMGIMVALVVTTMLLLLTPWRAIKDSEEKEKEAFHWFDMAVVGGGTADLDGVVALSGLYCNRLNRFRNVSHGF